MRVITVAVFLALIGVSPARAQCIASVPCGGGTITLQAYNSYASSPVCDSNDRTPPEINQCKVDYWVKELKERQASFDKAQKALNEAKERLAAFRALQR